jgi:hypothetical protein
MTKIMELKNTLNPLDVNAFGARISTLFIRKVYGNADGPGRSTKG